MPAAQVGKVEAQAESIALARKSVRRNGLQDRFDIREGELRDPEVLGADERFELRWTVADCCQTAAAHLQLGGLFACVFPVNPPAQEQRVVAATKAAGLAIVRQGPIVPVRWPWHYKPISSSKLGELSAEFGSHMGKTVEEMDDGTFRGLGKKFGGGPRTPR